jgi:hypothetical protein
MLDGPPDAHWVRHVARCVERVRRLKIPNGGWSLLALVEEHERHGVNLPQPLFRNLQELEVGIWTDEQQNTFGYLVSRSLRSLHLEISPRSGITNFEPLIQALSNHKAISLRLDHDSDALPKDFLTGVAKFASLSLSHIDTTEPLFAAMIHRARSRQYHVPYCTSVFIRHHEVDIALPHPQHFRPNNIGGDRLPFWTPILQDDNVWHVLRDIKIHQRQDIPVQYSHFVEFMHALGDKNSLESVEILNVEIIVTPNKKSGESPPALWPISFGIKLAKLIIETRGDFPDLSYSMTQDDLEFSFRSHKLEVFRIVKPNEDASNSAAPRLGLEAISWLINQNPKLHTLALSVDAMSTLYVPPPSPNKALRSLDFGRSWIDSPAEVASWLGEACVGDGLTWMQARSPLDELRATKWRKVKAIIQKQQKARRASQPGFVQVCGYIVYVCLGVID